MLGILLALAAMLLGGETEIAPDRAAINGDWYGRLSGAPIVLHIGATVTLDSPAQSLTGLPGVMTTREGGYTVSFAAGRATYDFTLLGDGSALAGTFTQNGASLPLDLTHTPPPAPVVDPRDREVVIDGGKAPLYGTLRTPPNSRPGPAVLFVAGSGPTDRDGNSAIAGVQPDTLKQLAAGLAEHGVASLRFDKRGIAKSSPALTAEADLRLSTYVDDAAAWARFLAAQPGVTCVVIGGHSEGALIAALAAQKVPTCGVISIAGAGRPLDQVIMEQLTSQALPPASLTEARTILTGLKQGRIFPNIPASNALFRPSLQPYLTSQLNIDPPAALAEVRAPVLIIQGDNDIQVSMEDARRLAAARPEAKLVVLHGFNHVLKYAQTDRAGNLQAYASPDIPIAREAVDAIVQFVDAPKPAN